MKKIKSLSLITAMLVSASSMADLVQPLNPVSEDSPVRISIGAQGGFGPASSTDRFGASSVGGGIGFTHNAGSDFNWGLSLGYDWTSPKQRIFTQASKDSEGNRINADLIMRYMPELADSLFFGLDFSFGWGHQFGQGAKIINESRKFGDLNLKVGPALSYAFSDSVSMYVAAKYALTNIRFGIKSEDAKKYAHWSGLDIPLGFCFAVSENAGVFVDLNTRFYNLAQGAKHFKEEVTVGMSFAI
jgi:opacity protein-like surface antigen